MGTHQKKVRLSDTAPAAMSATNSTVILNTRFVAAVSAAYDSGKMHELPASRIAETVANALRNKQKEIKLVPWTVDAINAALNYLIDVSEISRPADKGALTAA